jgi:hypothetical protein
VPRLELGAQSGFELALRQQRPDEVRRRHREPEHQWARAEVGAARAAPAQHGAERERQREERVDDEDVPAHHRCVGQGPEQLGAVDRGRVEEGMREQGQLERKQPTGLAQLAQRRPSSHHSASPTKGSTSSECEKLRCCVTCSTGSGWNQSTR